MWVWVWEAGDGKREGGGEEEEEEKVMDTDRNFPKLLCLTVCTTKKEISMAVTTGHWHMGVMVLHFTEVQHVPGINRIALIEEG